MLHHASMYFERSQTKVLVFVALTSIRFLWQLRGICGNLNFISDDERTMENGVQAANDDDFIQAYSFRPSSEVDTCGKEFDVGQPSAVTVVRSYVGGCRRNWHTVYLCCRIQMACSMTVTHCDFSMVCRGLYVCRSCCKKDALVFVTRVCC